jgi:hypothetical protein
MSRNFTLTKASEDYSLEAFILEEENSLKLKFITEYEELGLERR